MDSEEIVVNHNNVIQFQRPNEYQQLNNSAISLQSSSLLACIGGFLTSVFFSARETNDQLD